LKELGSLVADSLEICKHHSFLTGDFLATLPTNAEKFPTGSPFRPIYDAVVSAFKAQALIPTATGSHATAAEVVLGRSQDLRNLIPGHLLPELLGQDFKLIDWVDPAVTENRLPGIWHYLRDEIGVQVIDAEIVASRITESFLQMRDDQWMVQFYQFLSGREALWREQLYLRPRGILRGKPIIRCEDGIHRIPFTEGGEPVVYLPFDSGTSFPTVKKSIYADEGAKRFFSALGLVVPDLCATILAVVLPKYS